jgi:hypothetical protein
MARTSPCAAVGIGSRFGGGSRAGALSVGAVGSGVVSAGRVGAQPTTSASAAASLNIARTLALPRLYNARVPRLAQTLARIDELNRQDPNLEDGEPKELLYSRRMSECLAELEPEASEELQIAVRAQHVCRWKSARADYPDGRAGYKKWRSQLALMHAEIAAEVMEDVGYSPDSVERTRRIVQKRNLASDPESQALEDCACLVFLSHYFEAFAGKHERDKVVDIVRKSWGKMSDRARDMAVNLELEDHLAAIVEDALGDR